MFIHVCGTNASCSHTPNSFERSDHIVLEFLVSQIVRAHDYLCKAPPRLAQVYGHVSESFSARHITFAMCRAGTNSDTWQKTCASLGGALHKSNVHSRTTWGNPKLWPLSGNACALLWHLHLLFHTGPPIRRVWDRSDLT